VLLADHLAEGAGAMAAVKRSRFSHGSPSLLRAVATSRSSDGASRRGFARSPKPLLTGWLVQFHSAAEPAYGRCMGDDPKGET
jgi:hypothetical protein